MTVIVDDPELVRLLQIKELGEQFVKDHPIEELEQQIREALEEEQ